MDKFITILAILILVALTGCENANQTQVSDDWVLINHVNFNYSIEYPSNLRMNLGNEFGYKGGHYIRFIASTKSFQHPKNLIITVETRTAENPTLEDVIDWSNEDLDAIKSNPVRVINSGFEELFLVEGQIGDIPIYRRRYAYQKSDLLYEEVYLAREDDMVILTLSVDKEYFDEYLIIFNQMVDSFKPLN